MAISFRKKSLEKLSSPEELDTLLTITSPGSWAALITIGFCLAAATAWGIWGRVPSTLSGSGILLNPKGIFSIQTETPGVVRTIKAALGQTVEKGETLVILNYPEQEEDVTVAKNELAALQDDYRKQQTEEAQTLKGKKRELDLGLNELGLNIRINRSKIDRLDKRILNQKELLNLGLITEYDLADTVEDRDTARDRISTDLNQVAATEDTYNQARQESNDKLRDMETKIRQAREDLAEKKVALKTDELVSAPYDGIIVGVAAQVGSRVAAGDELFTLERIKNTGQKNLICRQYYPAATAKRIQRGMVTQVAPGTVQVDQYGYLLAQVTHVARFPSTTAQLANQLQNDELVKQIADMGTVLTVESIPIKADNTPSGYKWTSSQGPPYALDNGTPCTVSVIIEEVPPISLVIPMLKKYLLGIGEEQS